MDSPLKAQKVRSSVTPAAQAVVAPDGGYAWFVLLSCFLVTGLTFGVIKSFGVFYVEIQRYFETTATDTSWITSIAVAAVHVGAPISSALSAHFGHRSVVMMGGLLSSMGMVGGAYARNLVELYITVGLLNGFGYGLTWPPAITMLGWYFEKRRPMANALASSGECILTFLLTPFFQLLIDSYSWRGAMLVLGGLQLNLCVCGMLLRPLKATGELTRLREVKGDEGGSEAMPLKDGDLNQSKGAEEVMEKSTSGGTSNDTHEGTTKGRVIRNIPVETPPGEAKDHAKAKAQARRAELRTKVIHYIDYTLITNARFMVYSMFGLFAALGFFAPNLFLVPYARSHGVEEYQAAALMSISAALDLTGRVFFGWVANLRLVETVLQLTVSVILLGTVLLLCPLASSFTELAVFSAAYGLVYGATVSIHITVLAEVVGVQRLGSALGFFMLIRSCGGLLGPPIAGFFIDKMRDYGTGFLMAGMALIVSALFLLLLRQMNRWDQGSTPKGHDSPFDSEKGGATAEELDRWTGDEGGRKH